MKLRTDGIAWQELDGELVVLDLHSSRYLSANRSGSLLAGLLREDRSLDELADALVAEFGIDAGTARADAAAYVADLRAHGLLA